MYFPSGLQVGLLWTRLAIIGPRQRLERAGLAVVDAQNPLDGEEQLREFQVGLGHKDGFIFDGADHEAAVGRDLREQAESRLPFVALVVAPRDDDAPVENHGLVDSQDGVGAFVVRVIDIHPEDAAVGGERMAIAAHRQVLQHDGRRLRGGNRPEPPPNLGRVLDRLRKGQVHLPVEQRCAHLVGRGPDDDMAGRQDVPRLLAMDTDNGNRGLLLQRPALDALPNRRLGPPLRLLHEGIDAPLAVGKLDRDQPQIRGAVAVLPAKAGCTDIRRKQGLIDRVLDHYPAEILGVGQGFQHHLGIRPARRPDERDKDITQGNDRRRCTCSYQEISSGLSHSFLIPYPRPSRGILTRAGPRGTRSCCLKPIILDCTGYVADDQVRHGGRQVNRPGRGSRPQPCWDARRSCR